MGKHISIVSEFLRYRFKSENFSVVLVKVIKIIEKVSDYNGDLPITGNTITATGSVPDGFFYDGVKHVMSGIWANTKYGYQLKIDKIEALEPTGKKEIIKFLASGLINGIGPVTAERIVQCFGIDTLDVLDKNPQKILMVKGIGKITAEKIMSSWKEQRSIANLITTLCSYGLSVTYAKKALKVFGSSAIDMIRENPYILTEVRGVGFLKADVIAKELRITDDNPARITAGIMYCLDNATYKEGHCYLTETILIKRAQELMQLDDLTILDHLHGNRFDNLVFTHDCVYLKHIYNAERYVAGRINTMAYERSLIRKDVIEKIIDEYVYLTEEQKSAVKSALLNKISVLTGLPGTGKTYSLLSFIQILEKLKISYEIAAPTGKAARRISEVTKRDAKTIHRLLESKWDGTSLKFKRNEFYPLNVSFVIIDEMSMTDIVLMESLLRAIKGHTCLVLVGDYNQLPSVGAGRILKDMVEHSLCIVNKLTRIQRQAEDSNIVKAAHFIHSGEMINHLTSSKDLVLLRENDPVKIKEKIVEVVSSQVYATAGSTQVLSPMKKGTTGTRELNTALRAPMRKYNLDILKRNGRIEELSKNMEPVNGFLQGDKVIQTENNYEKEVFNGEIGHVIGIDSEGRTMSVLFDDRIIDYEDFELDQIDFAYALTVHKFQGSEVACVVMPITTQHFVMLYRNLIYTAITRAREKLVLVGSEKALAIAIKNNRTVLRYSGLGGYL